MDKVVSMVEPRRREMPTHQLLNYFLREICVKIQPTKTQIEKAEGHYAAIAKWLEDAPVTSLLYKAKVRIYPHGSIGLDTAVKPIEGDEFDLDLVIEIALHHSVLNDPRLLVNAIKDRLQEHETYRSLLEPKDTCLRLNYAGDFHMDLMGGCLVNPFDERDTRLKVADKTPSGLVVWADRNPLGYKAWFKGQAALERSIIKNLRETRDSFEVIPIESTPERKPALNYIVQLMKRARDVFFDGDDEGKKIAKSVVITTLTGRLYDGELELFTATSKIIETIQGSLFNLSSLAITNPVNPNEDFSKAWREDPARFLRFTDWIQRFASDWNELSQPGLGLPKRSELLKDLFGAGPAEVVLKEYSERMDSLSRTSQLNLTSTGMLATSVTTASSIRVPKHHFYGDE